MFSAMTSVNKLPGAFPSVHQRARERPTGSEFLTARIRLHISDCNEVVANCISWGPRHFPSLLPDCSSSLACFWNRTLVTSEWGPGVASPPPHGAGRGSPTAPAPAGHRGAVGKVLAHRLQVYSPRVEAQPRLVQQDVLQPSRHTV